VCVVVGCESSYTGVCTMLHPWVQLDTLEETKARQYKADLQVVLEEGYCEESTAAKMTGRC